MSRYGGPYGISPQLSNSKTAPTGYDTGLKTDRHDERSSHSGSDDGTYALFHDSHKLEVELEDDPNPLTSQALNADGTPKRPMNAFMIFARRRRPQVSAENQSMRTGEISKILSKEWVSMPASEKQFYLEQAKQLKETFNSKYPDYVYRRRPNNSRKRRRSDSGGSIRTGDHSSLADHPDDLAGVDLDPSLHGTDDALAGNFSSAPFHRSSQDLGHGFAGPSKYDGVSSSRVSLGFSQQEAYRSNAHSDGRGLAYPLTMPDRLPQPIGSPRGHHIGGMSYSYGPSHASSQGSSSMYPSEGPDVWQPRVDRLPPSWLATQQQPDRLSKSSYSPTSPSSQWSPTTHSPSSATGPPPSSQNYFPTLTTPFYPSQNIQTNGSSNDNASSVSPTSTSSSTHFDSTMNHLPPATARNEYAPRSYASPPLSTDAYGQSSPRDTLSFTNGQQRSLPPMTIGGATYHSQHPPAVPAAAGGPAHGFWPRD